ncbi:unnamed protein product [Urochloa humidicola]
MAGVAEMAYGGDVEMQLVGRRRAELCGAGGRRWGGRSCRRAAREPAAVVASTRAEPAAGAPSRADCTASHRDAAVAPRRVACRGNSGRRHCRPSTPPARWAPSTPGRRRRRLCPPWPRRSRAAAALAGLCPCPCHRRTSPLPAVGPPELHGKMEANAAGRPAPWNRALLHSDRRFPC